MRASWDEVAVDMGLKAFCLWPRLVIRQAGFLDDTLDP
jgi:hypothetical protein